MVELLSTKLFIPPLRPDLVPRPRLIQLISDGLQSKRKLTLVSAPAGFGKTTLGATLQSPPLLAIKKVLTALLNENAAGKVPLILALDEVHLLAAIRKHKCDPQLNSNKAN